MKTLFTFILPILLFSLSCSGITVKDLKTSIAKAEKFKEKARIEKVKAEKEGRKTDAKKYGEFEDAFSELGSDLTDAKKSIEDWETKWDNSIERIIGAWVLRFLFIIVICGVVYLAFVTRSFWMKFLPF